MEVLRSFLKGGKYVKIRKGRGKAGMTKKSWVEQLLGDNELINKIQSHVDTHGDLSNEKLQKAIHDELRLKNEKNVQLSAFKPMAVKAPTGKKKITTQPVKKPTESKEELEQKIKKALDTGVMPKSIKQTIEKQTGMQQRPIPPWVQDALKYAASDRKKSMQFREEPAFREIQEKIIDDYDKKSRSHKYEQIKLMGADPRGGTILNKLGEEVGLVEKQMSNAQIMNEYFGLLARSDYLPMLDYKRGAGPHKSSSQYNPREVQILEAVRKDSVNKELFEKAITMDQQRQEAKSSNKPNPFLEPKRPVEPERKIQKTEEESEEKHGSSATERARRKQEAMEKMLEHYADLIKSGQSGLPTNVPAGIFTPVKVPSADPPKKPSGSKEEKEEKKEEEEEDEGDIDEPRPPTEDKPDDKTKKKKKPKTKDDDDDEPKPFPDEDEDEDKDPEETMANKKEQLHSETHHKSELRPLYLIGGQNVLRFTEEETKSHLNQFALFNYVPYYENLTPDSEYTHLLKQQYNFRYKSPYKNPIVPPEPRQFTAQERFNMIPRLRGYHQNQEMMYRVDQNISKSGWQRPIHSNQILQVRDQQHIYGTDMSRNLDVGRLINGYDIIDSINLDEQLMRKKR